MTQFLPYNPEMRIFRMLEKNGGIEIMIKIIK